MSDEEGGGQGLAETAGGIAAHKAGKEIGKEVGKEIGKQAGTKAAGHAAGQAVGSAAPGVGNAAAFLVTEAIDAAWRFRKPLAALVAVVFLLAALVPSMLVSLVAGSAWNAVANLTIRPVAGIALAAYAASSECDFAGPSDPKGVAADLSTVYLVAMAFEATGSGELTSSVAGIAGGSFYFGNYRNPLANTTSIGVGPLKTDYTPMANTQGLNLNAAGLAPGGETAKLINATKGLQPKDWTSILPLGGGEHGVGFLLITPTDWRNDVADAAHELPSGTNLANLSPWRPQDAFLVVACHLKYQIAPLLAQGIAAAAALGNALVSFGKSVQQIWEAAEPILAQIIQDVTGSSPIQLAKDLLGLATSVLSTIVNNGNLYFEYLQGFLSGHLLGSGGSGTPIPGGQCNVSLTNLLGNCPNNPNGVAVPFPAFVEGPNYDIYAAGIVALIDKNQCTYGAIAGWLTLHAPDLNHPDHASPWYGPSVASQHPFAGAANAANFYDSAVSQGYVVTGAPVSGSLVVWKAFAFGPAYPYGHIATVVGVSSDGHHYLVLEQNWLQPEASFGAPVWNPAGFDLRSASWPDPSVAGFIWGPPGTKVA